MGGGGGQWTWWLRLSQVEEMVLPSRLLIWFQKFGHPVNALCHMAEMVSANSKPHLDNPSQRNAPLTYVLRKEASACDAAVNYCGKGTATSCRNGYRREGNACSRLQPSEIADQ